MGARRHNWLWISEAIAFAIHDEQLAEHGGASGIRHLGGFEAAMARPRNKQAYGEPDAADLAAAYAFGLSKAHAFVDGNKRIGLAVAGAFLYLNGYRLKATQAELAALMWQVADSQVTEEQLALALRGWITTPSVKPQD